jgi:hypothetical protein
MGDGLNQGARGAQIRFLNSPTYNVRLENIICTSLQSYSYTNLFNTCLILSSNIYVILLRLLSVDLLCRNPYIPWTNLKFIFRCFGLSKESGHARSLV